MYSIEQTKEVYRIDFACQYLKEKLYHKFYLIPFYSPYLYSIHESCSIQNFLVDFAQSLSIHLSTHLLSWNPYTKGVEFYAFLCSACSLVTSLKSFIFIRDLHRMYQYIIIIIIEVKKKFYFLFFPLLSAIESRFLEYTLCIHKEYIVRD